ncbi:MAG: isocitrate lyase/PEP mutase family protein [Gammaproteobacteria bacterium]|nr:isocitrate lyase/PEP mutase family protein [Gammaproteobacteria bacterium]
MSATHTLRKLLNSDKMIVAPGVFDGLSALLAKQAGFPVLYASGGAIARSMGYPDIGLVTMTEVLGTLARIVDASKLPIIADADTGFGGVLNVRRTVHEYERLGIAGLHIEDQTFPKRCGHLNDKSLISTEDMCAKIIAATESREDPDFLIIARTDAIGVEGFESAIKRAEAYAQAGADVLFIEAPQTLLHIEDIAKRIPQKKLINMFSGGKTPLVSAEHLKKLGYNIIIIPSDLQRAAIMAMQKVLNVIYQDGNSAAIEEELTSFAEREKMIGTDEYFTLDAQSFDKAKHLNISQTQDKTGK